MSVHFTRLASASCGKLQVVDVATAHARRQGAPPDARARPHRARRRELASRSCCTAAPTRASCARRASATRSGSRTSPRRLAATQRRDARARAGHRRVRAFRAGATSYRRLPDYDLEMKQLAMQYPSLVRPITLNHRSVLGRDVNGIEITTDAQNTGDGKPIFLIMGVHHAREWPSAEHAIEFAYDLLRNYGRDARTTQLVQTHPHDRGPGREPGRLQHLARGAAARRLLAVRLRDEAQELPRLGEHAAASTRSGTCDDNKAGRLRGTDPNRNYGGLWGGSGASTSWSDDTFRGDAPFSEPEVQNIRELISSRQVTNLITNHTYSNLVLRPPGVATSGSRSRSRSTRRWARRWPRTTATRTIPGFGLYDTTGVDRGLVASGRPAASRSRSRSAGSSSTRRTRRAWRPSTSARRPRPAPARAATARRTTRCSRPPPTPRSTRVIEGAAPAGSTLRISKTFQTSTSPVWQDDFGNVDRRPATVHRHAHVGAEDHRAATFTLAREPVHAADRGRPPRARPDRAAAGGRSRCRTRPGSRRRT